MLLALSHHYEKAGKGIFKDTLPCFFIYLFNDLRNNNKPPSHKNRLKILTLLKESRTFTAK